MTIGFTKSYSLLFFLKFVSRFFMKAEIIEYGKVNNTKNFKFYIFGNFKIF
jgi:hypothetical protein